MKIYFHLPASFLHYVYQTNMSEMMRSFADMVLLTMDLFKDIPDHHGCAHLSRVLAHSSLAINGLGLTEDQNFVVITAALLHDADDYKIFPNSTSKLENAHMIMTQARFPERLHKLVRDSILLVSCSTQDAIEQWLEYEAYKANEEKGHTEPEVVAFEKWQLIPRDADRLDAIGKVGVKRCLDFSSSKLELCVDSTPLPTTREKLLMEIDPSRFENYMRGVKSESTLDHFFDKLLHLDCADSENKYLIEQAKKAKDEMIELLLPIFKECKDKRDLAADHQCSS